MQRRAGLLAGIVALALNLGACGVWDAPNEPAGDPGAAADPTAAAQPDDMAVAASPTAAAAAADPTAEELFPEQTAWTGSPAITDRCTPMKQPERRSRAWFTRPGAAGEQPLAKAIARMICTAAPNSTIRIAMYFLKEDSADVERIMRALRIVAKKRNVTVEIVLDGSPYAKNTPVHVATLEQLDAIGDYYLCPYGCRSQDRYTYSSGLQSTELQHNKFVVMTDTIWTTELDPLLIQSSANWSRSQLSTRHQSGVMVYGDPVLAKHFDVRWQSLVECSNPSGSCAGWNARLVELGLDPDRYSVEEANGVWYDRDLGWLEGGIGRGISVLFSPCCHEQPDPVRHALDAYDCNGKRDNVWVGHLFITQWRPEVIDALGDLKRRGCDVRIIVSSFNRPHNNVGIQELREAGLKPRCVANMHDKIILVDAVNRGTGRPEKALFIGSQSIGYDALYRGDEAMLQITDEVPGSREVAENRALWKQFRAQWSYLRGRVTSCPV